jgi:hypothetical protein
MVVSEPIGYQMTDTDNFAEFRTAETMIVPYVPRSYADAHHRGLGGVILIDTREIDDLVALLTACTMLRRIEQRRWERSAPAGGGGGGGGG